MNVHGSSMEANWATRSDEQYVAAATPSLKGASTLQGHRTMFQCGRFRWRHSDRRQAFHGCAAPTPPSRGRASAALAAARWAFRMSRCTQPRASIRATSFTPRNLARSGGGLRTASSARPAGEQGPCAAVPQRIQLPAQPPRGAEIEESFDRVLESCSRRDREDWGRKSGRVVGRHRHARPLASGHRNQRGRDRLLRRSLGLPGAVRRHAETDDVNLTPGAVYGRSNGVRDGAR